MTQYFRKIILHGFAYTGICNGTMLNKFAVLVAIIGYTVDIICIFIELIVAQFETHILQYEQAGGQPDCSSTDIDGRKTFIFPEIAK